MTIVKYIAINALEIYTCHRGCTIMNKEKLVSSIAKEADVTKVVAARTLNAAIKTIISALRSGDEINLVGFGSFQIRKRSARDGRNPKTGEKIRIEESSFPTFKAGKLLKEAVN